MSMQNNLDNNNSNSIYKRTTMSAKDFFLNLGVMAVLYVSAISILSLWFKIIDTFFVDPLKYSNPYPAVISSSVASLIVIFPIFIFISWVLCKEERANPEKRELGVRKGLIYFTLFITGIVIVIDLIILIQTFLTGMEITASFISKVFIILIVIGTIFVYYMQKVRSNNIISATIEKKIAYVVSIFVIISIVIGFAVIGSPYTQRMKRVDFERTSDLQSIQYRVLSYWQRNGVLPTDIGVISKYGYNLPVDPITSKPYSYRTIGTTNFELCAIFNLSTKPSQVNAKGYTNNEDWSHKKGETCFERKMDTPKYGIRN